MREIKFRVWDKDMKYMHVCGENVHDSMMFVDNVACYYNLQNGCGSFPNGEGTYELMQYTGLKDRNGDYLYEQDVIDEKGVKVGNTYENYLLNPTTYLIIAGMCTKAWSRTEQEAIKRGCFYAE